MPFCDSCGRETTTPFCSVCGATTPLYDPVRDGVPTDPPKPKITHESLNRSPFQVLLLGYVTFGTYTLFWLIRQRRFAEMRLERKRTNGFWWLAVIVPFVNLWLIFTTFNLANERAKRAGVYPTLPFGFQGFGLLVVGALWRLPEPYWVVSLLSPFFLATIHASLWRAELADGRATPQRFNAWEIALLVVFGLFNSFVLYVLTFDHPEAFATIGCVLAIAVSTLAYFAWYDRQIASSVAKVTLEA